MGRKAPRQNLVLKFSFFLFACAGFLFLLSLVTANGGYSPDAVLGLLMALASFIAEHRL